MLQPLQYFYGFRADLLEFGPLFRLFPRRQQGDLRWAAQALEARACEHQTDSFVLYRLPELNSYAVVFQLDGEWVRCFEERPNLTDLARCLREVLTGVTLASNTPYIPSGTLNAGWDDLERDVRVWWWGRLKDNLNPSEPNPEDWPQRWADLLLSMD
ncbi:hypothetical protein ABS71_01270 [bacterium SCN 62-11]|nr:hypothetical protein [Candidatus Eremiobacteraeota bacterium]ODT79087.1 MAG: hypothetical protein ABS71_01270 [bacterium SCN 62-11]